MYRVGPELLDDPLYQAAKIRAQGLSWATVANKIGGSPEEAERLTLVDDRRWRWLLRRAEKDAFRELGCEAISRLKCLMRSDDPKESQAGTFKATDFWAGIVRHRDKKKTKSDSPFEPFDNEELTDEQCAIMCGVHKQVILQEDDADDEYDDDDSDDDDRFDEDGNDNPDDGGDPEGPYEDPQGGGEAIDEPSVSSRDHKGADENETTIAKLSDGRGSESGGLTTRSASENAVGETPLMNGSNSSSHPPQAATSPQEWRCLNVVVVMQAHPQPPSSPPPLWGRSLIERSEKGGLVVDWIANVL